MGNHTIKWGVDYRRAARRSAADADHQPARPVQVRYRPDLALPGAQDRNRQQHGQLPAGSAVRRRAATWRSTTPRCARHQFFAFVQDKWQVSSKLTLDFGLRWEFYPPPTPRFAGGFSNYNPVNNTLVMAGVGGNPMNMGMREPVQVLCSPPRRRLPPDADHSVPRRLRHQLHAVPGQHLRVQLPGEAEQPVLTRRQYNYAAGGTRRRRHSCHVRRGFPAPQPAVIPPTASSPVTGTLASQSIIVIPLDYKNPYVESWNFSVQQALPFHFTLDVAYVGNHGVRTSATYNLNVPTNAALDGQGRTAGRPAVPRTADTTQYFAGYSSMYNGLQVKLNRRFTNGLVDHHLLHLGQGHELPDRRRRQHLELHQSPPQLRPHRLRPHTDVQAELRLRTAVRRRQEVAESRHSPPRPSAAGRSTASSR